MGKYGGTILTGRDNFKLWQGNLEVELAAARLKKYLRAEFCVAPVSLDTALESEKLSFEIKLEDWKFEHVSALKMLLQSVDTTNRVAIQSCRTASEAYKTLTSRYAMKDSALLAQLLSQLFAVQTMKNSPITKKYDLIINLTSQIADQEPEAEISDVVQAVILMRSLPSDYDKTKSDSTNTIPIRKAVSNDNEYNEFSTYVCATASSSLKNAWGLDTMCSCHLTPHKDLFIGQIKYNRVPIEVANGQTIFSAGKGDVRIF